MRELDATLCHHLDQVPIRQPIADIPSHAQLNDVGVEGTLAVHQVTGYRFRHSAPRAKAAHFTDCHEMHQNRIGSLALPPRAADRCVHSCLPFYRKASVV
jgi:hypothetical protein